MNSFQKQWKRIPTPIRQSIVLIVGSLIVITGIILLPLPGPGWVIIFFGFALLATEFPAAEKVRDYLIRVLKLLIQKGKELWHRFRTRR